MSAIEADHYREEIAQLKADPVIQSLAADVVRDLGSGVQTWEGIAHLLGGGPRHEFTGAVTAEYRRRCQSAGTEPTLGSIGGPARAVLALVTESQEREQDEAELDPVLLAIAEAVADRGTDLRTARRHVTEHQERIWSAFIGPVLDVIEAEVWS